MPKSAKTASSAAGELVCGPLKPQADDELIADGTPAVEVLAKVTNLCDEDNGVFLFRYGGKLYLRVVGKGS
jgi:hypothetical protein